MLEHNSAALDDPQPHMDTAFCAARSVLNIYPVQGEVTEHNGPCPQHALQGFVMVTPNNTIKNSAQHWLKIFPFGSVNTS